MIFFMDQCSFSVRSEWRHLERSINELEEVKRVLSCLLTEKSHVQNCERILLMIVHDKKKRNYMKWYGPE